MTDFTVTSGELARQAGVSQPTVRKYADERKLDYVTASNGTRLFRAGQAPRVRELVAQGIARRGARRTAA